ncbi:MULTISPECIES: S1 family peptidase [Streptomyces]|uniref:S1 family peptidase n=1 Tax=Streptomyces dengpaensis TaxID=2049881 RepID=A0ABN5HUX1_9ACTN|nr:MULTISPECIES: S1 family peptidase [Streptomyces]AVH54934.1 S1 family peptidase [Streptomyces dengpaensis]PIB08233.1 serine protease [Streptomyces sp. HG99]
MRHARRRIVRRGAQCAAVGGLLCGGLMVTHAMASEPSDTSRATGSSAQAAADTGAALVSRLGTSRTAGSWIASDGRPVVAVTDQAAAAEVTEAGARAKVVGHSMRDLKSATATLSSAPRVAGTAWAMDYTKNEVVVRADSTVSASDWSRMTELADDIGGFVRMQRTEGTFTTRLNGAQPLFSTAGRCSAGFNVTNGQSEFILTAGHCGPAGSLWFADNQGNQQVGRTITTAFPGSDFSLVRYDKGQQTTVGSNVVAIGGGNGVRITGAADPTVGQRVFRSGSTSGLRDGKVTALNATVNYPEGTVTGLIETTVCAEPGDSGGPLFSEGIALGVTSGGNGDCTTGGTTFFQPVTKALTALDVRLAGQPEAPASAGAQASPAPAASPGAASAPPSQGAAVTPGSAAPGAVEPVDTTGSAETLVSRLTDPRNIGPGLLVIAGSLIALVATRYIRTEQDRNAYRREHARSWG